MTKYTFTYDVCASDYFQGSSGMVINVPVYSTTTYKDLKEGLLDGTNTAHLEDLDIDAYETLIDYMFSSVTNMNSFPEFISYIDAVDGEENSHGYEQVYFYLCVKVELD